MRREDLKVPVEKLRFVCDPSNFNFPDTSSLEPLKDFIGQERAIQALKLGLEIEIQGYNIFATGLTGTGRSSVIREHLKKFAERRKAEGKVVLKDFCYIYNFDNPDKPMTLIFAKGKGRKFRGEMEEALKDLLREISEAFQEESHLEVKKEILERLREQEIKLWDSVDSLARQKMFILKKSPFGFNIIPIPMSLQNAGEEMPREELDALDKESKAKIRQNQQKISSLIDKVSFKVQKLRQEARKKIYELEKKLVQDKFQLVFDELKLNYQDYPEVLSYFSKLEEYTLKNIELFKPQENNNQFSFTGDFQNHRLDPFLPFKVNLFVDNTETDGPPIIIENNPTFANLFGRIKKRFLGGGYFTDHTLIEAGSLARADGGYLVINNVIDLFRNNTWWKLEKTLKSGYLKIEEPLEYFGYSSTNSLNPQEIPIQVKVIVIGEPEIYQLLIEHDDDFLTVFKVKAEFDYKMPRNQNHLESYAGFIAFCCQKEKLLPFSSEAVAKVVEEGIRLVNNQKELSTQFGRIKNLVVESNYWALKDIEQKEVQGTEEQGPIVRKVKAEHVKKAVEEKRKRVNLLEEHLQEYIKEGILLIDTAGEKVGQINGLAVYGDGDYAFGRPFRITAKTFLGQKGVINIEREVKLGGPIQQKGVLILGGYLGKKYGQDKPLTLSASLCSEQSYSFMEGDSASVAELIVILSDLAGLAINQSLAVTGSMNQHGEVQPIGGVNQKIEGFFDICKEQGLTGKQGVIIPYQNINNLMLREDVIEAVSRGEFQIFAIKTVDEGIELLMGQPAEEVHKKVDKRLKEMAKSLKEFSQREL